MSHKPNVLRSKISAEELPSAKLTQSPIADPLRDTRFVVVVPMKLRRR